jgi:hypothetical protein
MCLFERSGATPKEGIGAELVVLDEASNPQSYEGKDVRGKFVLIRQADTASVWKLAVNQYGAAGLITDYMAEFPPVRYREDLPDALQRSRFREVAGDPGCVGFVLSPRAGDGLRDIYAKLQAEPSGPKPLILHAKADTTFFPGRVQNAMAFIPGLTDEEVLMTAHLCHPRSMAVDNASGVAAVMEAARAINDLISSGRLPKPRRSLRFLLVPEMTGTFTFLASNGSLIPRVVAGINLDMVGASQELCKGPLVLETPPRSQGMFGMELLEKILLSTGSKARTNSGTSQVPLFKYCVTPFSGGSDHYILSDPTVGIPTPMMIQWPDKFYHTSYDTMDKLDPVMLGLVTATAATYAYFLAKAGYPEAIWLASEMSARACREVADICQSGITRALEASTKAYSLQATRDQCDFYLSRRQADMQQLKRILPPERVLEFEELAGEMMTRAAGYAKDHLAAASRLLTSLVGSEVSPGPDYPFTGASAQTINEARSLVPVRLYRGPVDLSMLNERMHGLSSEEKAAYRAIEHKRSGKMPTAKVLFTQTAYWADGSRSAYDIARKVGLETGVFDIEFVTGYIRMLVRMGFMRLA